MPCSDGLSYGTQTVYVESGNQTSRLCAVFKVLEHQGNLIQTLQKADWKEAGVSLESTLQWWERHKRDDKARKAAEQAAAKRKRERHEALMSLTPRQRKALGL